MHQPLWDSTVCPENKKKLKNSFYKNVQLENNFFIRRTHHTEDIGGKKEGKEKLNFARELIRRSKNGKKRKKRDKYTQSRDDWVLDGPLEQEKSCVLVARQQTKAKAEATTKSAAHTGRVSERVSEWAYVHVGTYSCWCYYIIHPIREGGNGKMKNHVWERDDDDDKSEQRRYLSARWRKGKIPNSLLLSSFLFRNSLSTPPSIAQHFYITSQNRAMRYIQWKGLTTTAVKAQPLGEKNSDQSERDIDFISRFFSPLFSVLSLRCSTYIFAMPQNDTQYDRSKRASAAAAERCLCSFHSHKKNLLRGFDARKLGNSQELSKKNSKTFGKIQRSLKLFQKFQFLPQSFRRAYSFSICRSPTWQLLCFFSVGDAHQTPPTFHLHTRPTDSKWREEKQGKISSLEKEKWKSFNGEKMKKTEI